MLEIISSAPEEVLEENEFPRRARRVQNFVGG